LFSSDPRWADFFSVIVPPSFLKASLTFRFTGKIKRSEERMQLYFARVQTFDFYLFGIESALSYHSKYSNAPFFPDLTSAFFFESGKSKSVVLTPIVSMYTVLAQSSLCKCALCWASNTVWISAHV